MTRKLILSAAVAIAATTGVTVTPAAADAQPLTILPHHHFEVLVRRNGDWERHGTYRLHVEAEVVARRLRHQGLQVEIRQY